jgi:S1-C subfamily serine protease
MEDRMKPIQVFLALALCLPFLTRAQDPKPQMMMFSADNSFMLQELGAIIVEKEKVLTVEMMPPKEIRSKETKEIDLQKGDIVQMANGKRMRTIKDFQDIYEKTSIGSEFKMGIRRGETQFLVALTKKSNEELAKAGGPMRRMITKKEGEEILPALGLIISEKNKRIVISSVLPNATPNFKEFEPKENDVIASVNGKPVGSIKEFLSVYDGLSTGDKVTMELVRNSKATSVTFAKPQPQGKILMRK